MVNYEVQDWIQDESERNREFYDAYTYMMANATGPGEFLSCKAELGAIYLIREFWLHADDYSWQEDIMDHDYHADIMEYIAYKEKRGEDIPLFARMYQLGIKDLQERFPIATNS